MSVSDVVIFNLKLQIMTVNTYLTYMLTQFYNCILPKIVTFEDTGEQNNLETLEEDEEVILTTNSYICNGCPKTHGFAGTYVLSKFSMTVLHKCSISLVQRSIPSFKAWVWSWACWHKLQRKKFNGVKSHDLVGQS